MKNDHFTNFIVLAIGLLLLAIASFASVMNEIGLRVRIEHLESIIKEKPNAKTE